MRQLASPTPDTTPTDAVAPATSLMPHCPITRRLLRPMRVCSAQRSARVLKSIHRIAVVSSDTGSVIERLAYDPWGKRRYASGLSDTRGAVMGVTLERGYTLHEHLDELGVIHMNGRIFDPLMARFMSADPFIQAPTNLQSHNRYAYVMNNPLIYSDPSGYFSLRKLVGFISFGLAGNSKTGRTLITLAACASLNPVLCGTASALNTYVSGGSVGQAVKAGLISWGTAEGFNWAAGQSPAGVSPTSDAAAQSLERYAAHAAVGCASAVASGGQCGQGAASAVFGKFATNQIGRGEGWLQADVAKGVASSIAGGVGSVIAGGKFENGAVTAAFGYLFNELLHSGDRRSAMLRAGYRDGGSTLPYDPPLEGVYPEGYLLGTGGLVSAAGASLKVAFSGGANSVFWSGYSLGALEAAGSLGTTLEKTVGGRFLSWIDHSVGIKVPDSVWNWASSTFANNATGTAQAVIRAEGRVWSTIEKPILQQRGVPVEFRP
jgi:RHS repeat-associated protein